jgi:hypothetical protein
MSLDEEESRRPFLVELHKVCATETAKKLLSSCRRGPPSPVSEETLDGHSPEAERKRTYDDLVESSDLDLPIVWVALGHAYLHGWGTEESTGLAIYWYRKAADSGHTDAMLHIAHALLTMSSNPSEAEKREARSWYRQAAALGNPGWITWLGFESRRNCKVEVDYDEALGWFGKAFTKIGSEDSAATLGWGYMPPNEDALDYFLRIAATGEPESCFFLGLLFGDPAAPFCDLEKAMDWMIQAVERKSRNSPRAKLELAWHCFLGSGHVHDIEGSYSWLDVFFDEPFGTPRMQSEARRLLKLLDDLIDQQLEGGV